MTILLPLRLGHTTEYNVGCRHIQLNGFAHAIEVSLRVSQDNEI